MLTFLQFFWLNHVTQPYFSDEPNSQVKKWMTFKDEVFDEGKFTDKRSCFIKK
jgi:hypothetical protein